MSHTTLESVLSCAFCVVVSSALLLSLPLLVMVLGAAVSAESAVVVGSLLDNDDDDDDDKEEEVPGLMALGSVAVNAAARLRISFSSEVVVSLESVLELAFSSSSSPLLGGNVGSEMLTLRPPSLESFFALSALSSSSSSKSASKSSSVVPRLLVPPPAPPPRPLRSRIGPMVRNK